MNRDQLKKLERDLWAAADKLRANSDLKASEYSTPVLDEALPDTYERALFKQKCDYVFDLVVDYASRGRKWAA